MSTHPWSAAPHAAGPRPMADAIQRALTRRCAQDADARDLLVLRLAQRGLSPATISAATRLSVEAIRRILEAAA